MKFLQELVESKIVQLDEGAVKLKLYDAIHTAVKQSFDRNVSNRGNIVAATLRLFRDKDAGLSKADAEDETIQDMIADSVDACIDSIIASKVWVEMMDNKDEQDVKNKVIAALGKLKAFLHIQPAELEHRVIATIRSIKTDKRVPVRESESGLDDLYQALQNARSEVLTLYKSGALSEISASAQRMILDNLLRAVRKEDMQEFKRLYNEYAKEYPDAFDLIMDAVYGYLGVSDYEEFAEKTLKEAATPVKVDEFELEVDFDQVHLLDGEKSIRVSMPLKIWLKLAKQSISRYG